MPPLVSLLVNAVRTGDADAVAEAVRALGCLSSAYANEPTNQPSGFAHCLVACGGTPALVALLEEEAARERVSTYECVPLPGSPDDNPGAWPEPGDCTACVEYTQRPASCAEDAAWQHVARCRGSFALGYLLSMLKFPPALCCQVIEGGAVPAVICMMAAK